MISRASHVNKITRYTALNKFCRQKFIEGETPTGRIVVSPIFADAGPAPAALSNRAAADHTAEWPARVRRRQEAGMDVADRLTVKRCDERSPDFACQTRLDGNSGSATLIEHRRSKIGR